MNVICLEDDAFYKLVEEVVQRLADKKKDKAAKWISASEAMKLLGITSTTTLQNFRDQGRIRYSRVTKKNILYDVDSINEYLNDNSDDVLWAE
jgi:Helix-turn-helix domain